MEPDLARLSGRIECEFTLSRERLRSIRHQEPADHRSRQDRLAQYENACRTLQKIWEPRLQTVRQRLKDGLKVPIAIRSNRRQAALSFVSSLARIRLSLTAMTDADVRLLVLEYDLEIVPSLVFVPTRDRLELPLQQFDPRRIKEWVDDRVVTFVRTTCRCTKMSTTSAPSSWRTPWPTSGSPRPRPPRPSSARERPSTSSPTPPATTTNPGRTAGSSTPPAPESSLSFPSWLCRKPVKAAAETQSHRAESSPRLSVSAAGFPGPTSVPTRGKICPRPPSGLRSSDPR